VRPMSREVGLPLKQVFIPFPLTSIDDFHLHQLREVPCSHLTPSPTAVKVVVLLGTQEPLLHSWHKQSSDGHTLVRKRSQIAGVQRLLAATVPVCTLGWVTDVVTSGQLCLDPFGALAEMTHKC